MKEIASEKEGMKMPWTDICQNVRWRKILLVYLGILDFDTGSLATKKKEITFPKVALLMVKFCGEC